jgi:hypothetical protein
MSAPGRPTGHAPPPPPVLVVEADHVAAQPWRNGGGLTRELLRLPAEAATWDLRISLADIEADGPFSPFPGIERHFAVIAGEGVRLQFRHRILALVPGDPPLAFDGAEAPGCALTDGATRDLNVMVDRRAGRATLELAPAGVPWRAPAGVARGVFAVDPVRLRRGGDGGDSYSLPARTLVWCAGGDPGPWTLEASAATFEDGHVAPWPLALRLTFERHAGPAPLSSPPPSPAGADR